jgi:hypothetical protein
MISPIYIGFLDSRMAFLPSAPSLIVITVGWANILNDRERMRKRVKIFFIRAFL